jgi:hypothetical protein
LRDTEGRALYVGKSNNIRRRLRTHFSARRWRGLKPEFARATGAEWLEVASELEALLREAAWIQDLQPTVNIQVGAPNLESRAIPPHLLRHVIVVVRSVEGDSAELIAARADGPVMIQRTRRSGVDLAVHARRLWRFFRDLPRRDDDHAGALAPIVFSWLADRGAGATRFDPGDAATTRQLRDQLASALRDERLFSERIVVLNSRFRLTLRALSSVG